MNLSVSAAILCVLVVALLSETTYARPPPEWLFSQWRHFGDSDTDNIPIVRYRRLSDQRMAELETLMALEKIKGVAVPVGLGKVDPAAIGRKRRSISAEPVQNVISTMGQSDLIRSLLSKEHPREEQRLPANLIENVTRE
ncbi:uncharacterized protein [Linepithema humile]|uniref:uncharacterized protein n=1 Tax=Linepithema humile TaxID=83485 RepID=UPI0006237A72|nr:PREDICTED: uncharacterized protein LOC105671506 [Linepithema humile]